MSGGTRSHCGSHPPITLTHHLPVEGCKGFFLGGHTFAGLESGRYWVSRHRDGALDGSMSGEQELSLRSVSAPRPARSSGHVVARAGPLRWPPELPRCHGPGGDTPSPHSPRAAPPRRYGGDRSVRSAAPITTTEPPSPRTDPCLAHLRLFGRAGPWRWELA